MKKLAPLLFLIFIIGCSKNKKVVVEGELSNAAEKTIYFNKLKVSGEEILDSLELDKNGKFKFKIFSKHPEFLILRISENNFIQLQSEPNERIEITGDAENLPFNYFVEGSEGSQKIKLLNDHLVQFKVQLDSVINLYKQCMDGNGDEEILNSLNNSYDSLVNVQRRFSMGFVLGNLTSFASIAALYQKMDSTLLVFHKASDLQFFKLVSDSLRVRFPRSPHVRALINTVNSFKKDLNKLKLEEMVNEVVPQGCPEIALPNVNGDTIYLSSLRGKFVLLSFWSSENNASVQKNLELLKVYEKFNSTKFEIFQVSFDNNKEKWESEIKFSGLPWINVSDLKYPDSEIISLFNVPELPFNYLIDPSGNIAERNLSIEQLNNKLKNILN